MDATRFAADLARIWSGPEPVGLAVSGGADSLGLLLLAHRAIPGRFEAATVDHRLRAGSAIEAAAVGELCDARGIAHRVLPVEVQPHGNLQAAARAARYRALGAWAAERGVAAIATAHHLDDQAETLLMRLVRGAGVRGLAGMRARSPLPGASGIALLRPLLGWRRAELADIVATAGLEPAADPSNLDQRFTRVAMRARLAEAPWLEPAQLAASAAHLAQADDALTWAADREFAECVTPADGGYDYVPQAPSAVRLRVVERLVGRPGAAPPRGAELGRLIEALESGRAATLAGTRCQPLADGRWRFTPAPPRRGSRLGSD